MTRPTHLEPETTSILRQPVAVWAIAFACAVSFMGIGLVDPILPAISAELEASASQTMLLFTSYLLITSIAMFFSGFISSRLGLRATLLLGLALIVVFAGFAGASETVNQIIGFRGGWGLGNALFISTALAAIVGSASGGSRQAIVLYEAALGVGMAIGPLLGGTLGSISWRAPFFGTAALMAIGFIAITVLLRRPATEAEPVSIAAGFKALRHPALLTLAVVALFYNYGFFTLLAYTPYPLEHAAAEAGSTFGAHELGLVFFGWGIALAISSVIIAPALTRRFALVSVLTTALALFTLSLVAMAFLVASLSSLILSVALAGIFMGILNTALTEAVMEATDLPRKVASSTYSGVRFLGGAIAPAVSGGIADTLGAGAPYLIGAVAVLIAIMVLILRRDSVAPRAHPDLSTQDEAMAVTAGDEV